MDPIFVSIREAARLLGLSRSRVYELLNEGALETKKVGVRRLVRVSSIREFAEAV